MKYLNYIVRTLKKYLKERGFYVRIRMLVIYTADVERGSTRGRLDVGCLQFELTEVFLTDLDSARIEAGIRRKLERGESLSDDEVMQFIILPLTYTGVKRKQECIERCFELAKQMPDASMQVFALSGILVFTDKVITEEYSNKIRSWIGMTKVGRMFYEEKIAYVKEYTKSRDEKLIENIVQLGVPLKKIREILQKISAEEINTTASMEG